MMTSRLRAAPVCLVLAALSVPLVDGQTASRYRITRTGDLVRLEDARAGLAVSIVATMSNAYEVRVKGQDVLRKTFATVDEFKARPRLNGIPLLAPFANRLDEPAFYANGRKYNFDLELGNVRGPIPIHGYLSGSKDWQLVDAKADAGGAWLTSTLEFYRFPQYMHQFPFAHTITMTYRVRDGMLEVETHLDNLSAEPMPVALGFHPYFQLTDSSREEWSLAIGARTHWKVTPGRLPTGETEPIEAMVPDPGAVALASVELDDVFSDLERDAQGRALVSLEGRRQRLDVLVGPTFKAIVLYSPDPASQPGQPGRGFVAIEPMAGITNSLNLAHRGAYGELQSIAPGGSWTGTFWIRPQGF